MRIWRWLRYRLANKRTTCSMCGASLLTTRPELRREGVCSGCEDDWMSRRAW